MMNSILSSLIDTGNQGTILFLLILAVFRVYLEVINFRFNELPISKALADKAGTEQVDRFHRMGFIFSLGYIILFAPGYLIS